jgi:cell volume regulation protein A
MLGLLRVPEPDLAVPRRMAALAGLLLTFVARPLSVLACVVDRTLSVREQVFVSWAGLRGAVPIVLDDHPAGRGGAGREELFDIVFVMVVIYTLLTGPTLPWVAAGSGSRSGRAARPRRGGGAAGADRGRPAADQHHPQVRACTASRWASCGCRSGPRCRCWCGTGRPSCPTSGPCCAAATTCSWSPAQAARGDRGPRLRAVSLRGRLADWLGGERA